MKPLVSIIVPVFNAKKYLSQTIDSALKQTWPNIEILIIDDGSDDASFSIAKSFTSNNLKVFQQKNKGASAARNLGIKEAQGEYIQFLDADDLLSPNKITEQVNLLLKNPNKLAVCSTVHFFGNENLDMAKPSAYEDSFLYDNNCPADFLINLYGGENNHGSMVQTNAWLTPMAVIKKAGNWSEFYSPDDDGEYFCRVLLASEGIVYAKNCFNYYRKYNSYNNLAAIKTKEALYGKFDSFLLKKKYLLNATNNTTAKKALAHSAMDLALEAYMVDKKLAKEILQVIKVLGGTKYLPTLGGKQIEFIKQTFGWKTAVKLRYYYQKALNS